MTGGVGTVSLNMGNVIVGALAVVNAVGDVVGPDGIFLRERNREGNFWAARVD